MEALLHRVMELRMVYSEVEVAVLLQVMELLLLDSVEVALRGTTHRHLLQLLRLITALQLLHRRVM